MNYFDMEQRPLTFISIQLESHNYEDTGLTIEVRKGNANDVVQFLIERMSNITTFKYCYLNHTLSSTISDDCKEKVVLQRDENNRVSLYIQFGGRSINFYNSTGHIMSYYSTQSTNIEISIYDFFFKILSIYK